MRALIWTAAAVLVLAVGGAAIWLGTAERRQNARLEKFWLADRTYRCCQTPRAEECREAFEDLIALEHEGGAVSFRAVGVAKECRAAPEFDPATASDPKVILCGVLAEPPIREDAVRALRDQGKLWTAFADCNKDPFAATAILSVALKEWDKTCAKDACLDALIADYAPAELAGTAAQPHAAQVVEVLKSRPPPANWFTELNLLRRILGQDAPFAPLLVQARRRTLKPDNDSPQYKIVIPDQPPGPLASALLGADNAAAKLAGFALGVRELTPLEESQALEQGGMCAALPLFGKRLRLAEPERAEAAIPALVACDEVGGEFSKDAAALALTDKVVAALIQENGYDEDELRARHGFVVTESEDSEDEE